MSDTIRRALICLVVVGGCSSESSAPATTTTSSGDATEGITAEVERDRQFGTEGKLGLGFVNHTAAAQQLHDFALDSPLFEVVPPEAREVLLRPDGIVITMPMSFGPAICDPGAPAGPSVVVATIDGAEQRLPVDDAPLRAQHARDCAVRGVFEAADIRFGDDWESISEVTMAGQVELRRRGEDDVTVEGITGSVLFSVTADGEISDALQVDADREVARVDVVVSAAGCTPHALIEAKRGFRFPMWVRTGDGEAVQIELEPTGAERAPFEALLERCAGG
ncbi:MAG TPA: hypothetical protein VIR58_14775 [Acidimicrobiales bacterium]